VVVFFGPCADLLEELVVVPDSVLGHDDLGRRKHRGEDGQVDAGLALWERPKGRRKRNSHL